MIGVRLAQHAGSEVPQRPFGTVRVPGVPGDLRLDYPLGLVSLVGLYYGAAHLGYAFDFTGPVAAIVWLPVGVGISFLYLGGLRFWPGVVIGDLLVNNYATLPIGSALGQSCGNLLEVVVATVLLRRFCPQGSPLATVPGLASMLAAIAAGTAVSAAVGSLSLRLGNVVGANMLVHVWRTWWLGDFSGALIVLPLALAWVRPPPRPWLRGRALEGALLLATVVGLSELSLHTRSLAYVTFPALIWAALRFGQRGATLAITVTAGFTIWASTHYFGPFAYHSINRSVLDTQLFIAIAALSTLSVAALVSEREELTRRVRASRARLVEAGDAERQRLGRDLHDGAQQRLVALAAQLGLAADEARESPTDAAHLLETAEGEVALAIDELRELAHGIHPPVLRDFGLARAVEGAVARSSAPIHVVELPHERLDYMAEVTAYYVVLESITNAQKYGQASSIRVVGHLRSGWLEIAVSDDGIGGAIEARGFGLQSLRDRVEAIGGSFTIESERGRGTRISAAIPITVNRQQP
jgi:signal transduction histidine kinase